MTRRTIVCCILAVALALSSGCSQIKSVTPVGGGRTTMVRTAAVDELLTHRVAILTAPVCSAAAHEINCAGTTVNSAPITVISTDDDAANMSVSVGGQPIYSGSIQSVLDSAARPTS